MGCKFHHLSCHRSGCFYVLYKCNGPGIALFVHYAGIQSNYPVSVGESSITNRSYFRIQFGHPNALFYGIKATIGLRVPPEEELEGLDVVEHGAPGYGPDVSATAPAFG